MKYFVSTLVVIGCLAGSGAWAKDAAPSDDTKTAGPAKPTEPTNRFGKIEPTSDGSTGQAEGTPADATAVGASTIGASEQPVSGAPSAVSAAPNPYPNAAASNGTIAGGSVNGTGALNSAHPGH